MLDSTPENFHESAYNPDVLIEVPYNIVIQDIENVDQIPVISTNNSVIEKSLQNVGINYVEPLVEPVSVQSTPEKMSMLSSNPEYQEPVKTVLNGRKQTKTNKRKEKQMIKNCITSNWIFLKNCGHKENNQNAGCKIDELSVEEVYAFRKNLSDLINKIDQDKFILTMISISLPTRTDRHKSTRKKRNVIKYFVPNKIGVKIPVCLKTFSHITNFTPRRLNILASTFLKTGSSPKEKRGGNRMNQDNPDEVTLSIIEFISQLKCKKSHYARSDSGRSYLPPQWSVKYLWEQWNKKRILDSKLTASRGKFHKVFINNFNLSFGHPRQDVCSYCSEMNARIQIEDDTEKKMELNNELQSHKICSKIFSKTMLNVKPGSVNVSFDMMQNQPIPKLSVTDTFYSRQIWLYNLTFCINFSNSEQSPENCHLYTWVESESARGPNEVCSILLHFLEKLQERIKKESIPIVELNLFSDSCSAQNKNQFVVAILLYYINYKNSIFNKINHIFPVRGHSYMPPDQVFGRIEKCLRKKEILLSPQQYYDIFKKFATLHVFNKDFFIYDIKKAVKKIMKPNVIKTTEQKIFIYYKGKKTVDVSSNYNENPTYTVSVLKRGSSLSTLDTIDILPKINYVKIPKQKDVKNLMRFFVIPEDAKDFYKDIFRPNELLPEEEENDVPIYNEDAAY